MASSDHSFYFVRAGKLHFFCPLCHYHQSTNTIQRISWKHHLQLVILTIATAVIAYPIFGWKGLSFYLLYWAIFEFVYRFRKRQALICESCGFDPFLYLQDVDKARKSLRSHWEKRIEKENLFANLKLRNYKTGGSLKGEKPENPEAAALKPEENAKEKGVSADAP